MAAVIWWGYPRSDSAALYVRPDADGLLTAVCCGQLYSGGAVALADGMDRVGNVNITGLPPDSRNEVQIFLNGVLIDTASARTAPLPGAGLLRVVFLSCQYSKMPWIWDRIIELLDPVLFVYQGDVYIENPDTDATGATGAHLIGWGEDVQGISSVAKTDPARQECVWGHQRQFRRKLRGSLKRTPSIWLKSDHDGYPGNGWDRTVATANGYNPALFADLAEVDQFHGMVDNWLRPYHQGNPPNDSVGRDTSRSASDQLYFSLGIGNLRLLATEHYTYQNRGDDVPRYQLGATQEQWIYDTLKAATEPLKIWACSPGAPWLPDAMGEGNRIFDVLGNPQKYGWRSPGGLMNFHGDIHVPFAEYDDAIKGHGRTLLRINASPCGTGQNPAWNPNAVDKHTIYSPIASTGSTPGFFWTIGLAEIQSDGSYMDCHLLDEGGNKRFSRRVHAGSNEALTIG